jgi:hypothetical protein
VTTRMSLITSLPEDPRDRGPCLVYGSFTIPISRRSRNP